MVIIMLYASLNSNQTILFRSSKTWGTILIEKGIVSYMVVSTADGNVTFYYYDNLYGDGEVLRIDIDVFVVEVKDAKEINKFFDWLEKVMSDSVLIGGN